jgi:glycosyltransferase involved in cell wall biosynthesis
MLVKDEADVIAHTLTHLLENVDAVIVSDNGSTDGTIDIVSDFTATGCVELKHDPEVGYWQSQKTTRLALEASQRGFSWVVPCDADECWVANDHRRLGDFLDGIAPDVRIARAELYDHFASAEDDPTDPNPFSRMGWRHLNHAPLGKVCVRAGKDVVIQQGNHGAKIKGFATMSAGLNVRHFSWRSPEQYLRKIRNGAAAYAATDLPEDVGGHWRMFNGAPDSTVVGHYWKWFYKKSPRSEQALIYDPIKRKETE